MTDESIELDIFKDATRQLETDYGSERFRERLVKHKAAPDANKPE